MVLFIFSNRNKVVTSFENPWLFGRLVEKKELTDDDLNNMTWQQNSDLIQKDPLTCARNFEHIWYSSS